MKILVVTAPELLPREFKIISGLFEQGLETLHIRKPGLTITELREYISSLPVEFHARLMLHNHHELAQEFQVKGLHFPEMARGMATLALRRTFLFSTSYHQLKDVLQAPPCFDYAFLSPVFDSISKKGYKAAFEEAVITPTLQQASLPVVALGGVDRNNIVRLKRAGFVGAAVLGAIWQSGDPVLSFKQLQDILRFSRLQ